MLFDIVKHQERVVDILTGAWGAGKIAHAMLFWGPAGVGKLRMAQATAQMLLCSAENSPCGLCPACSQVSRFVHPDLFVVTVGKPDDDDKLFKSLEAYGQDIYHQLRFPPKASIVIERIRNLKVESAKSQVGKGNRVIIIREAEKMTLEAAQSALKLIEEPRPGTYLILTCREPEALLPTILSRCQRIRFRPLPGEYIKSVLLTQNPELGVQSDMIARLAQGSLGRAMAMVEEDVLANRDLALSIFDKRLTDPTQVRDCVHAVGRSWDLDRAQSLVDMLMLWYEDILMLHHGLPEEHLTHLDRLSDLRTTQSALTVIELKRRCGILEEMLSSLKSNVNPELALSTTLLRMNNLVTEKGYR